MRFRLFAAALAVGVGPLTAGCCHHLFHRHHDCATSHRNYRRRGHNSSAVPATAFFAWRCQ